MSYEIYKVGHLWAILVLFLVIGYLLGSPQDKRSYKKAMMWHGLAVLVLFVSGFGLMARLQIFHSWPFWLILKLGIWGLLAVLFPILLIKKVDKKYLWLVVGISLLSAVCLVVYKPVLW